MSYVHLYWVDMFIKMLAVQCVTFTCFHLLLLRLLHMTVELTCLQLHSLCKCFILIVHVYTFYLCKHMRSWHVYNNFPYCTSVWYKCTRLQLYFLCKCVSYAYCTSVWYKCTHLYVLCKCVGVVNVYKSSSAIWLYFFKTCVHVHNYMFFMFFSFLK